MSVARFCVCGFLLGSNAIGRRCPACGRSDVAIPSANDSRSALAYGAVELDSEGKPSPAAELPRLRSKTFDAIAKERRGDDALDISRNPWPNAGTLEDCILFPLKSILWILILAIAWAAVLIVGVTIVSLHGWSQVGFGAAWTIGTILVLGFTHRLMQYAYASSQIGRAETLGWPRFRLWAEMKAGLVGLLGLFAGPIPVGCLAAWFWVYAGRLEAVDRAIVFELVVVSLVWWLLVVVASHEFGSVDPRSILKWFDVNGWLPLAVAAVAMTLAAMVLWFAVIVLSSDADAFARAIFIPAALVWLFAVHFILLRWMGVRARRRIASAAGASGDWRCRNFSR